MIGSTPVIASVVSIHPSIHPSIHTYIHTYIHIYIHTYIRYLYIYNPTSLFANYNMVFTNIKLLGSTKIRDQPVLSMFHFQNDVNEKYQ